MPGATSLAHRFYGRSAAAAVVLGFAVCAFSTAQAGPLPGDLETNAPQSIEDLKAIQKQVKTVLDKVVPCTVCLQVGGASGSGIIISKDGYILTAGHVSGTPDKKVKIIFADGKEVYGKTLGQNKGIDSGMVKINDEERKGGDWPFIEMGKSASLQRGQWVISVGHPGGYKKGRSPVVRLGRLQRVEQDTLTTDCTLVGGDSGGPLFDMEGKVIGIHSRIGPTLALNMHVPVDTYRETWERLAKGESWGGPLGSRRNQEEIKPYLGLKFEPDSTNCKVAEVTPDSPAAKAGLKVDDLVMTFDGKMVANYDDLLSQLKKKKPGEEVVLEVARNKETLKIKIVVGKAAG
jgi:serine protease Do